MPRISLNRLSRRPVALGNLLLGLDNISSFLRTRSGSIFRRTLSQTESQSEMLQDPPMGGVLEEMIEEVPQGPAEEQADSKKRKRATTSDEDENNGETDREDEPSPKRRTMTTRENTETPILPPPFTSSILPTPREIPDAPSAQSSFILPDLAESIGELLANIGVPSDPTKTIYDLPNEVLNLIAKEADSTDLLLATSVCKLFHNIFLPIYLSRYDLGGNLRFIHLERPAAFRAFQLLHRSPQLKSHVYLTAYISSVSSTSVDVDTAVSYLTHAISCLPIGTFELIDLSFFPSKPVGVVALHDLMRAVSQSRCPVIHISDCSITGRGRINSDGFTSWPVESLDISGDLTPQAFRPVVVGVSSFLVNLRLQTGTMATNWKTFLDSADFPQLETLDLSEDVCLRALIRFLNRHPQVSRISIIPDPSTGRYSFPTIRKKLNMATIKAISGPLPWLLALLRNAVAPPSLSNLCIFAERPPHDSVLPAIFQCLALCNTIQKLEISLPRRTCQPILKPEVTSDNDPYFTHLRTEVFRISFTYFSVLEPPQDTDIMAVWTEWCRYLPDIKCLEMDQHSPHDRRALFQEACTKFSKLGVSIRTGMDILMENELAR